MEIKQDLDKTRELNEKYHTLDQRDRREIHLSDDLGHCPGKAWCRILGYEAKWNRGTKARFNIGEELHGEFELPFTHREIQIPFGDSTGHPDVVINDIVGSFAYLAPLEFKHTTRHFDSGADLPSEWLKQLKLECVYLTNWYPGHTYTYGWIAILEVVAGVGKVYKVQFTVQEIVDARTKHENFVTSLKLAIQSRDINYLILNRECPYCEYNYKGGCPERPTRSLVE